MANLHQGVAFSPQTVLSENIGAADTIIKVYDSSVFPDPPNYATIGTDELGETIEYAAKAEGLLSGCTRGVEGAAKSWQSGEIIARNFTAKDHNDLISSVTSAQTTATAAKEKADAALPATSTATAATKLATARTIQANLASNQAESFNGTANVTPGVTGILPVAHGGTNATTAAQALANLGGLPLSGGTMTGPITGITVPTVDTDAASKLYVDSNIVRPNLIDNCNFSVWQRYPSGVYEGVPDNIYIADRFKITSSNGSLKNTFKRLDGGGILNEIGANCVIKYQREDASVLNGKKCTLSYLHKDASGSITLVTCTKTPSGLTSSTDLLGYFVPGGQLWIRNKCSLLQIKLEIGSTQTLAHKEGDTWVPNEIPDYGTELLKCQRYFERIYLYNGFPLYRTNANRLSNNIFYKTTKRVNPTITSTQMYVVRRSDNAGVFGAQVHKTPFFNRNTNSLEIVFNEQQIDAVSPGENAYLSTSSQVPSLYIDVNADL